MILLPTVAQRIARIPFLFRAHECLDTAGLYALSYGQRVYAVHTRAGVATACDQNGRLVRVPSGMPRISSEISGTVRQPTLLLEPAVTNYLLHSQDFSNAAWSKTNVTVTANAAIAPDGTLTADKVAATAAAATTLNQVATTIATTAATASVHGKIGSGATDCNRFLLRNETTGVTLVDVTINWTTGIVTGVGGIAVDAANGWWRVILTSTTGLTSGDDIGLWAGFVGVSEAAGEFAYFWQGDLVAAAAASSPIPTTSAPVPRAVDALYFPLAMPPRALTIYQRSLNRGQYLPKPVGSGGRYSARFGAAATASSPYFGLYGSASGIAGTQYHDGSSAVYAQVGNPTAWQSVVEHRGVLRSDWAVEVGVSVAGAAELVSAASSALTAAAAFADTRLYFVGPGDDVGVAITHVAVALGTPSLDELRDLCEVG